MVRMFFTADIHGSEKCIIKFVNAAKLYKADVSILGGDITGKAIIPIVERPNDIFETRFLGIKRVAKTRKELERLESSIRFAGFYPYRCAPKQLEELKVDEAKRDELFSNLMIEQMRRWIGIIERRLQNTNLKLFIMPGNDDRFVIDSIIDTSADCVNPEGKVVMIDQHHEMISTGYSNITPWRAPRDISEDELTLKIERMASQVKDMENCIFNFHCPPFNTPLDEAPEINEQFRPVKGGVKVHVGSTAVRAAIMKHQPLLGLHGHIHESKGFTRLGRTLCMNPGSEYGEGILHGALIDLDKKGVKNFMFTSG